MVRNVSIRYGYWDQEQEAHEGPDLEFLWSVSWSRNCGFFVSTLGPGWEFFVSIPTFSFDRIIPWKPNP